MSANTTGISSLQVNISIVTPLGGPRVFDDVIISSISDDQNTVVDLSIAIFKNILSLWVIIFPVCGIDGDRYWLDRKTVQEVIFRFSQSFMVLVLELTISFSTVTFDGFVRVFILGSDTVLLNKVQSSPGHTSIASHIAVGDSGTVN